MKIEIEITPAEWKEFKDFIKHHIDIRMGLNEGFAFMAKAITFGTMRDIIKKAKAEAERQAPGGPRRKLQITKPYD